MYFTPLLEVALISKRMNIHSCLFAVYRKGNQEWLPYKITVVSLLKSSTHGIMLRLILNHLFERLSLSGDEPLAVLHGNFSGEWS